ncbi:oligosaccharide flippase family protein [candidate division WWE3 bacterium]|nr:oligosaccharide flippase family protein [candidate division WWE3 bacterium]
MSTKPSSSTRSKPAFGYMILRGTALVVVSDYLVYALNFVRGIILARLLAPEFFGLMAMAEFFRSMLGQSAGIGFDQALIQRQEKLEVAYNGYYLMINILTIISFIVTLSLRQVFLHFYDPLMYKVLVVLMGLLVIQTLSSTHITYLRKNLSFGRISIIILVSSLLAFVVSVYGAMHEWGVWSLVSVTASTTIGISVLGWILCPWKLTWKFDRDVNKSLLTFGGMVLLGNFFAFLMSQFDDFLVGQYTTFVILGYYSKAYGLAQQPLALFSQVINKISGPLIATVQNDHSKLSKSMNLTIGSVFKGTIFLGMVLFMWAPQITSLLIGEQWLPMVPLLRGLIVYLIAQPIWDLVGSLFTYIGKPQIYVLGQAIQAIMLIVLGWITVRNFGAYGMSIIVSIIVLSITILFLIRAASFIQIDWWNTFFAPIIAVFLSAFGSWYLITPLDQNSIIFWIGIAIIPTCLYVALLFLLQGKSLRDDFNLLLNVARKKN